MVAMEQAVTVERSLSPGLTDVSNDVSHIRLRPIVASLRVLNFPTLGNRGRSPVLAQMELADEVEHMLEMATSRSSAR